MLESVRYYKRNVTYGKSFIKFLNRVLKVNWEVEACYFKMCWVFFWFRKRQKKWALGSLETTRKDVKNSIQREKR